MMGYEPLPSVPHSSGSVSRRTHLAATLKAAECPVGVWALR